MTSTICTLFEGDYHYGLGALANSLYKHGYRGAIFAGFRGPMPPWAAPANESGGFRRLAYAPGAEIVFVPVEVAIHLTNHKPAFLIRVWEEFCSESEALFYFDPDIVVRCRWSFFEEWVRAGVAVCEDINNRMPVNHPIRHGWREHCSRLGIECKQSFDSYHNAGFLGVSRQNKKFLNLWRTILESVESSGARLAELNTGDRTSLFCISDQDALNAALMVAESPISAVGQEGMDFQHGGGGYVMSHAAGGVKPWRKKMLSSIAKGIPPTRADKGFFSYAQSPIQLYGKGHFMLKRADLLAASALARYFC